MNPVKIIGRYEFPIGSVVMVEKRTGWKGFFKPGYNVVLASGTVLYMNETEKAELDHARGIHSQTMEVLGIVATLQRNNQPTKA